MQLGKYTLHEVLGKGGFGTVYRATGTNGRVVAVKILKPGWSDDASVVERFRREAMTAGTLYHPHIATILDLDEVDGRMFLVMRYVNGPSLDKVINERGPLPWAEVQKNLTEIASALDFAHQKGFVHRDIKPANILISAAEGAVLTDFGLARAASSSGMSTSSVLLGTPNYMAPELWQGKTASAKTDVYSLACVAIEMLTGNVLFTGDSPGAIMTKHLMEKPVLPEAVLHGISAVVPQVLARALEKDPASRFPSASTFAQALSEAGTTQPEEKKIPLPALDKQTENQPTAPFVENHQSVDSEKATQSPVPTIPVNAEPRKGQFAGAKTGAVPKPGAAATAAKRSMTPVFCLSIAGVAVLAVVLLFFVGIFFVNALNGNTGQAAEAIPTSVPTLVEDYSTTAVPTADIGLIAFSSRKDGDDDIYVVMADGGGFHTITETRTMEAFPAWSPDGKRIAYCSNQDGNAEIYVINADGSELTRLTENDAMDWYPAWSPEGNSIAFTSHRDGNPEIYIMDIHGANVKRLTNDPSNDAIPAWSPDGEHISFTSSRDEIPEIFVMDKNGSNLKKMTNGTGSLYSAWSPDGKRIAYVSKSIDNGTIFVMNEDGSNPVRVADNIDYNEGISWTGQ